MKKVNLVEGSLCVSIISMALLSIVTRHYNTVVLLGACGFSIVIERNSPCKRRRAPGGPARQGCTAHNCAGFGLLFTFGYDMAVSAYVPSPRPAHHTPLHNALVRHPNRCMGGGLLALGLVNVLHLAPVPGALVAGAVLSAVSLHADWELFTFMATTTHPTSEYAPMLWFNVGADLVGTLLCLLGLVGLPFAFPRFYNAMLLAVVSFLMALSPLMFGGSIAAATSAPTAAWLAIAWAQYAGVRAVRRGRNLTCAQVLRHGFGRLPPLRQAQCVAAGAHCILHHALCQPCAGCRFDRVRHDASHAAAHGARQCRLHWRGTRAQRGHVDLPSCPQQEALVMQQAPTNKNCVNNARGSLAALGQLGLGDLKCQKHRAIDQQGADERWGVTAVHGLDTALAQDLARAVHDARVEPLGLVGGLDLHTRLGPLCCEQGRKKKKKASLASTAHLHLDNVERVQEAPKAKACGGATHKLVEQGHGAVGAFEVLF